MTSIPSPAAGPSSTDDHAQVSRHFLERAKSELLSGDTLQASEKGWGAAAHALKAIAIQRGWNHHAHYLLNYVSDQLAAEFERPDFHIHLALANEMHRNFYENYRDEDAVSRAIDDIGQFISKLEEVRNSPPRSFTVSTRADQQRLRWLLGVGSDEVPEIGARSEVGFSKT